MKFIKTRAELQMENEKLNDELEEVKEVKNKIRVIASDDEDTVMVITVKKDGTISAAQEA